MGSVHMLQLRARPASAVALQDGARIDWVRMKECVSYCYKCAAAMQAGDMSQGC